MTDMYKEPLEIETNDDSMRIYKTALVSDAADLTLASAHKVRYGDRYDNLAFLYYKTPTLWWVIAKANGGVNGAMTPLVGSTIYIPKL